MRVFLTGATGFIGRRVRAALAGDGHDVVAVARTPPTSASPRVEWVQLDFRSADRAECWLPHLHRTDVVINAAGTFAGRAQTRALSAVHTAAPIALFEAARQAGVRRIVQLSALGAQAGAPTAFLRTKYAADAWLLQLSLAGVVVRPSLVFGPDGASSTLLLTLASMPVLMLPEGGRQRVQPIHVDDLTEALCLLAVGPHKSLRGRVDAVGPRAMMLAEYLNALRQQLGLMPASVVAVPRAWAQSAMALGERLWPNAPVTADALRMLSGGSVADVTAVTAVLGRQPRSVDDFVPPAWRAALRAQARLGWLLPVLRVSIAIVWIVTGVVSLAVFPVAESHAMLARAGIPGPWQHALLLAAGWTDIVLGLLTLALPRRWLWRTQAALIGIYSIIIAVYLPEFWIHPFGPLVKNVPMLAVLWLLDVLQPPVPRRSAQQRPTRSR